MTRFSDLVEKFSSFPVPLERGSREGRHSAVLMALTDEDDTRIVLTRRALTMRFHPGQVSFPGGSLEDGETPVQAALRETEEEVGLAPSEVAVLGELPDRSLAVSSNAITPIIGAISPDAKPVVVDAGEVHSVHQPTLTELANPEVRYNATLPGLPYRGPAFIVEDIFVWGFTAHLLDGLLRVGGWEEPWDQKRTIEVPSGFRRERHYPRRHGREHDSPV